MRLKISSIFSVLGFILIFVGLAMVVPLVFAFIYGEAREIVAFLVSMVVTSLTGLIIYRNTSYNTDLSSKEGILIGSIGWLLIPVFGCLPYLFSGVFTSWFDAYFEAVSGFTTTGATVLVDVEIISRSVLVWRSFTQWLGGMGILLVFVAVMPRPGVGSTRILKAETAGPITHKIVPRMGQFAKYIWLVYFVLTGLALLALWGAGLDFFDALNHTFTSISTGGFSTRNLGLSAYNNFLLEIIAFAIIIIGGGNFLSYYVIFAKKNPLLLFKDEEYRAYLLVLLVGFLIVISYLAVHYYDNVFDAVRYGAFQVLTLKTGTGHFTFDYDLWGSPVKTFLFVLMFFGGCQYSTTGGIKMVRMLIALKFVIGEITRYLHPNIVYPVKIDNRKVQAEVVTNVVGFFLLYAVIFFITSFMLAGFGFDMISAVSGSAAILGNVGPAMGLFGPTQTYAELPGLLKLWLSIVMVLGRLEIYPILALVQVIVNPQER